MKSVIKKDNSGCKSLVGGLLLALFSVLAQYSLPVFSIGVASLLLYTIWYFAKGENIYINLPMFVFVLFSLLSQIFIYIFSNTLLLNRNTYLYMLICLFILSAIAGFDAAIFEKIYTFVGTICGIIIILQFIQIHVLGQNVNPIMLFHVSEEELHYWNFNATRCMGFFSEPQAYCSYILPAIVIGLFRHKYLRTLFFTLTILLSGSSEGILLSGIIWLYYWCQEEKRPIIKGMIMLIGGFGVLLVMNSAFFQSSLEKIMSINLFGYDIRLTKGWQIYSQMPILDKLTGIGNGNLTEYLLNHDLDLFWLNLTRPELVGYVTTMSGVFISFGIFGGFLYVFTLIVNIWRQKGIAKLLCIIVFIASFAQTLLFNAWFIYMWGLIFMYDNHDDHLRFYMLKVNWKRGQSGTSYEGIHKIY